MLRRKKKRPATDSGANVVTRNDSLKKGRVLGPVLGEAPEKDEVEKLLEQAVLGGEEDILEKLEENVSKHKKASKRKLTEEEAPEPVWEDEDDEDLIVKPNMKEFRFKQLPLTDGKVLEGSKYHHTLKKQFEKVSGSPAWAKLRWEKSESESKAAEKWEGNIGFLDIIGGNSCVTMFTVHNKNPKEVLKWNLNSESDNEELLQRTGNYLTGSQSLPKGIIQLKKCRDINKDDHSSSKLQSLEFHPTAQVALTAGTDQTLRLFQVDGEHNPKIQSIFMESFPIHTAHFSTDGNEVIMSSHYRCFYYFDMIAGKVVNVPKIKGLEEHMMRRFKVSPDGKTLVFLGGYGRMHLISAQTKEWISTLKMNGNVTSVAFSRDGSKMFSFGDDGDIYVWDMATRDCVHRFVDDGCIKGTAIAASHNDQYIACGSHSGVVNIYNSSCLTSQSPKPVKAVMNLTSPCTGLVFHPSNEMLAMCSNYTDNAVKLLHFPSLTVFSNFPDRREALKMPKCMDFSLHGGYFCLGNNKGKALLYRVKHYGNY